MRFFVLIVQILRFASFVPRIYAPCKRPRKNQGTTKELRTTKKCFLLRLPSLLPLLYLAWFYREYSERRPKEDRKNTHNIKVFFLRWVPIKLFPFLKKIAPKSDFSCISPKKSVTLHPKYKYYGKHQYSRYWI